MMASVFTSLNLPLSSPSDHCTTANFRAGFSDTKRIKKGWKDKETDTYLHYPVTPHSHPYLSNWWNGFKNSCFEWAWLKTVTVRKMFTVTSTFSMGRAWKKKVFIGRWGGGTLTLSNQQTKILIYHYCQETLFSWLLCVMVWLIANTPVLLDCQCKFLDVEMHYFNILSRKIDSEVKWTFKWFLT